ncbi:DUF2938 family protein [Pukyongiella litopenaei]|uniref:DUF2938 family protein n=2 Tax=Pukyongiella litopenaei TaxID=2605946 RepID=A0A2S0MUS4_9RHOB|nr:DUF2938 family protein [Pukyongiella litopenaei]
MGWSAEVVARTVATGIGATMVMDVAGLLRARLFGVPGLDWGLVGRWAAGIARGRFLLPPGQVARATTPSERLAGWGLHYSVGIVLAAGLTLLCGPAWLISPPLLPVLGYGTATVVLPFFILQPGLGLGVAARKVPTPWLARRRSVVTHAIFGCGLYLSARAGALLQLLP